MTRASTVMVERATLDDVPVLAAVMADAFLHTPDSVWLVPDTTARRALFARFVPELLAYAVVHGRVDTTLERDAAAVWWRPDHLDVGEYRAIIADTCVPYVDAFARLDNTLSVAEPHDRHQTLAYLGVTPLRQGCGIGTALLRHGLARYDRASEPTFLVASSSRSRSLYERHGYTDIVSGAVRLPGGPLLWPMVREPRPSRRPRPTLLRDASNG